ncbi:Myb-like DNA-binding domain containing protein [Tritrichomonas foetus]|uniref:Myb-like DNA-binding domain containing protein n=1 Tax=Tritrichomonas foetus TaxID=1144522 RepID=A0A1J4KS84_9EUKA|nr:Myb-like DNA-binding domain containing protein [Tritrichomonas foetus]|eukprot:OHT14123.1 Myb-like DNA-binding domain containing protein [Tritrichomonas foetus]
MTNASTASPKPLLEYAVSNLIQQAPALPETIITQCRMILDNFIYGPLTYEECKIKISSIVPNVDIVDEIRRVLSTDSPARAIHHEEEIEPADNDVVSYRSKGRTRLWTKEEDRRLLHAIYIFGLGKWKDICVFVGGGRTRAQCSQRWYRSIDPRISKDRWTSDEDQRLMQSVTVNGDHTWTKVAFDVKTRTDVQCRYRYNQIQKSTNYSTKKGQNVIQGNQASGEQQNDNQIVPVPVQAPPPPQNTIANQQIKFPVSNQQWINTQNLICQINNVSPLPSNKIMAQIPLIAATTSIPNETKTSFNMITISQDPTEFDQVMIDQLIHKGNEFDADDFLYTSEIMDRYFE